MNDKIMVIYTHNPDLYFRGEEPPELTEIRFYSASDSERMLREMMEMSSEGYYAIKAPLHDSEAHNE